MLDDDPDGTLQGVESPNIPGRLTSHWSFEDWGRFLPEHTTAVSLLDRLLHRATTVVNTGQSYRMRDAKTRSGGRPTT